MVIIEGCGRWLKWIVHHIRSERLQCMVGVYSWITWLECMVRTDGWSGRFEWMFGLDNCGKWSRNWGWLFRKQFPIDGFNKSLVSAFEAVI
jgi:hypothetical protein